MAIARAYSLGKIPEDQKFRGQAKLIIDVMSEDVAKAKTTPVIAAEIKDRLTTRQDPERVVAFYMSVWKKKGWVKVNEVTVDQPQAAAASEAESAPQNVHEEVGPVAADNHAAVNMEVAVAEIETLPDLHGMKLSEAVVAVLTFRDESLSPEDITKFLNDNGYEFAINQVNSAIQNLIRKGTVTKTDGDLIDLA